MILYIVPMAFNGFIRGLDGFRVTFKVILTSHWGDFGSMMVAC